jgi:dihydroorotase
MRSFPKTQNISVLNAEKHFLSHLRKLSSAFPNLRIVLEHATTAAAVECIESLPSNVACSITPHHLVLTIDNVVPQPFHFCKPIAKEPSDRAALRRVIKDGNSKFFLGSDSAPHPVSSKLPRLGHGYTALDGEGVGEGEDGPSPCAAGIYTSAVLIPLVAHILDSFGALSQLENFVSTNGRRFYGVEAKKGDHVVLRRVDVGSVDAKTVPGYFKKEGSDGSIVDVVPFMAGQKLGWEIVG